MMAGTDVELSFKIDAQRLRAGAHYYNQTTDEYVKRWRGDILLNEDDGEDQEIGCFHSTYVDAESAVAAGWPVEEVFDEHGDIDDYWAALYDGDRLRKSMPGMVYRKDYARCDNLLIVDLIMILPQYRGRGFGLTSLVGLINNFRLGTGLIAIKPCPLQFASGGDAKEDIYELAGFDSNVVRATQKLRAYYHAIGFRMLPKTPFMVLPPFARLPQVCELLKQADSV